MPVQHLIGAACVIDCSRRRRADADFLLTRAESLTLGDRSWAHPAARLGADAHRLVQAHGSRAYSRTTTKPASTRPDLPRTWCGS